MKIGAAAKLDKIVKSKSLRTGMQERIRNLENFAQIATQWAIEMEESQQRIEAAQRRRDELIQQMLQAVAVMQAEIVRIDETHS